MPSEPRPIRALIVAGPTAAGKSELACDLAERFQGEVVGADSRQVYRYMDAGTAKPSASMRERVPHHLVDVVDPDRDFDAATWLELATEAIAAIVARGRLPVVCGGTGLYLRALLHGMFAGPGADPELRARLEAVEREHPGRLHEWLSERDPESAARIHLNDRLRTIRALEVLELTGRRLSQWHREQPPPSGPETLLLAVDPGRERLRRRIDERARSMLENGLVEELRGLRQRFEPDTRAFSAIGYRQAGMMLDGRLPSERLAEEIATATQRYAKRQRTWLRAQTCKYIVGLEPTSATLQAVENFVAKPRGMR